MTIYKINIMFCSKFMLLLIT